MAPEVRDRTEVNARLLELSPLILPEGIYLYQARLDELREQTINPRSMPQSMFDQLVKNIQASGGLESAPLCAKVDERLEIVSGHHRVRAARAAGVNTILVYVYEGLSISRLKAKQLAHNTISGTDDPEMVKRVWAQITEIEAQFEAFVDPRVFETVPERVSFTQVDVDMGKLAKTVLVIFLSSQKADWDAAIEKLMPKGEIDEMYLASRETYDEFRGALQKVREDLDIVSIPAAIAEMARCAVAYLDLLEGAKAEGTEA